MASFQAHFVSFALRHLLKPRIAAAQDVRQWRRLLTARHAPSIPSVRVHDMKMGQVEAERAEFSPQPAARLLYLHGGGYFACSPRTHRPITTAFAAYNFEVFTPDYRLAPEHPFPAALDDALAAYRWLRAQPSPARIVVAGDSAGGGLALALLLSLRDAGDPLPTAAALFSPWTDLAASGESLRLNDRRCAMFTGTSIAAGARFYAGKSDPRNPLISPLYGDLRQLPPLLVHVGENEVLRDDSTRLAARAEAAGCRVLLKIWPAVPHCWQIMPVIPEARQSIQEAAHFLMQEGI